MLMKGPDDLARRVLTTEVPEDQVMLVIGEPTFEEMGVASKTLHEKCGSDPDMAIMRYDTYRVLFERKEEEEEGSDPNVMGIPVTLSDLMPRGVTSLVIMSKLTADPVDPSGIFMVQVLG